MSSPTNKQFHANATASGGVLGIVTYLLIKFNVDPALTSMALPMFAGLLSYISTKIGDPTVASFIGTSSADGKPLTMGDE
jgi:hypothetical protein